MKACGENRKKYFYVHISAVSVIYTRIDWLLANANLTPMQQLFSVFHSKSISVPMSAPIYKEKRFESQRCMSCLMRSWILCIRCFFGLKPHIKFPFDHIGHIWTVSVYFTVCGWVNWSIVLWSLRSY